MTLQDQFEKEHFERPYAPYCESVNPEQWYKVLAWTEEYVEWLERKITSDNSARAEICPTCRGVGVLDLHFCDSDCHVCKGSGKLSPVA